MRDSSILVLVCGALMAAPSLALAEEAEPPVPEMSAPDEEAATDAAPETPAPSPSPTPRPSPAPITVESLSCGAVACRCVAGDGDEPCAELSCTCAEPLPADHEEPRAQVRPTEVPAEPPQGSTMSEAEPRPLPAALDRPAPFSGFTTVERVAAKLAIGFPFLELEISFRAHDVVHLSVGYRSLYVTLHGGYGAVRLRLYRNARSTRGLSLRLLGGMIYDTNRHWDAFCGTNGAFGELELAFSARRRIHSFDVDAGVRFGWIRARKCEASHECEDYFDGARAGLLPAVFVDLGYTVRITPALSYFFAVGVNVNVRSGSFPPLPRFRNGLIVEF